MNSTAAHERRPTTMPSQAWIGQIAREVVRRLQSECGSDSSPAVKLVTLDTLQRLGTSGEIHLAPSCVVTPAAEEEAKRRGIQLVHAKTAHSNETASSATDEPSGHHDDALLRQLALRGVALPADADVVWTRTPAAEVCRHCACGKRAVMITAYADVDRFAAEISPQVWVLDAERLSLVAATNIAVRIARRATTDPRGNR